MNSKGTEFRIALIGFFIGLYLNIFYFNDIKSALIPESLERNITALGTQLGFADPVTFLNLTVFFTVIAIAIFLSSIIIGQLESYTVISKDELDRLLRR